MAVAPGFAPAGNNYVGEIASSPEGRLRARLHLVGLLAMTAVAADSKTNSSRWASASAGVTAGFG